MSTTTRHAHRPSLRGDASEKKNIGDVHRVLKMERLPSFLFVKHTFPAQPEALATPRVLQLVWSGSVLLLRDLYPSVQSHGVATALKISERLGSQAVVDPLNQVMRLDETQTRTAKQLRDISFSPEKRRGYSATVCLS